MTIFNHAVAPLHQTGRFVGFILFWEEATGNFWRKFTDGTNPVAAESSGLTDEGDGIGCSISSLMLQYSR